jgi:hypothetical protein
VRLTCVRHAASVDPEPGSNSSKDGEAANSIDHRPRRPRCGGLGGRLLHTSVGKVPATQKRVGYRRTADSALGSPCQSSAPEREMVSLSTGSSIPGGLRFGKEPGVPVLVLYRLRLRTRRSLTTNESIPARSPLGKELATRGYKPRSTQIQAHSRTILIRCKSIPLHIFRSPSLCHKSFPCYIMS